MPFASKIKINILNSIIVYKNQPETKQYYYAYINAAPCIRPRSEIQKKNSFRNSRSYTSQYQGGSVRGPPKPIEHLSNVAPKGITVPHHADGWKSLATVDEQNCSPSSVNTRQAFLRQEMAMHFWSDVTTI